MHELQKEFNYRKKYKVRVDLALFFLISLSLLLTKTIASIFEFPFEFSFQVIFLFFIFCMSGLIFIDSFFSPFIYAIKKRKSNIFKDKKIIIYRFLDEVEISTIEGTLHNEEDQAFKFKQTFKEFHNPFLKHKYSLNFNFFIMGKCYNSEDIFRKKLNTFQKETKKQNNLISF